MNWMKVALNSLRWKLLVLGALGGLWGSLLHESALLLPPLTWAPAHTLLAGAALGLCLGLFLAPADALLQHTWHRVLRAALGGALLGALLGAAGTALQLALHDAAPSVGQAWAWATAARVDTAGWALALGLIAAGCGLGAQLGAGRHGRPVHGALQGFVAGTLLALILASAAAVANFDRWATLAALVTWSALLALALHWWERRRARRWLRLLTGPGEDNIFPLHGVAVSLGKNERNDIPLRDFQEVYPYHCELRWAADHYEIIDNEQGGVVLVNYRQVQEHVLRPGDLIKIGSALLQYGEAS